MSVYQHIRSLLNARSAMEGRGRTECRAQRQAVRASGGRTPVLVLFVDSGEEEKGGGVLTTIVSSRLSGLGCGCGMTRGLL